MSGADPWLQVHSHVILDEPLDFVAGVFVLAVFHAAVFKLVLEHRWTEQDDSSANGGQRGEKRDVLMNVCCSEISSLCPHILALDESLGVGVSKAVLLPQGAGGLQELSLSGACAISKEPWEKKLICNPITAQTSFYITTVANLWTTKSKRSEESRKLKTHQQHWRPFLKETSGILLLLRGSLKLDPPAS